MNGELVRARDRIKRIHEAFQHSDHGDDESAAIRLT
jgi:hypothetical protein